MGVYRLYSTPDGESHLEETPQVFTLAGDAPKRQATKDIIFWHHPKSLEIDWHPAPRPQYIFIL